MSKVVEGMGGLTQASAMPPCFEFGCPESAEGFEKARQVQAGYGRAGGGANLKIAPLPGSPPVGSPVRGR